VEGHELQAAYGDGRLTPDHILLTDQVPSEVPRVAGIITLAPSTPNSHVAILSQTFGVPFAYTLRDPQELKALAGKEVILRVRMASCAVEVIDVEGALSAEARAALTELARPGQVQIQAKAQKGAISLSTDDLTAADIVATIRRLNSTCRIIVRCRFKANVRNIKRSGASVVLIEEMEASQAMGRLLEKYSFEA